MSCETCKGYSSHNCPCCATEFCEVTPEQIDDCVLEAQEAKAAGQLDCEDAVHDLVADFCGGHGISSPEMRKMVCEEVISMI